MGDDVLHYNDFVKEDGSIDALIGKLNELNSTFGTVVNSVKSDVKDFQKDIKAFNTNTEEGRISIASATAKIAEYQQGLHNLGQAVRQANSQLGTLQNKLGNTNGITQSNVDNLGQLGNAYSGLVTKVNRLISLWNSYTKEQKQTSVATSIFASRALELAQELSSLGRQLNTNIKDINAVRAAQEKLNFANSEAGKMAAALKQTLKEQAAQAAATAREQLNLAKMAEYYSQVTREELIQMDELRLSEKDRYRYIQLTIQANNSLAGSYNQLSAQYSRNKLMLNAMSAEIRFGTKEGRELAEATREIYDRMRVLQESTGNFKLSVGAYREVWSGLGYSVQQVVREIPAAAISLNTFFLAISNNIPIVIDELKRAKIKNDELARSGKDTIPLYKQIAGAILSWQTALIILLGVMSKYGSQIINWFKELWYGAQYVKDSVELLKEVTDSLEKHNDDYGKTVVNIKKLQREWTNFNGDIKKQEQFIKDNAEEWKKLGVEINNVNDAENLLVGNADAFIAIQALKAKAAAATALAQERYTKALVKTQEAVQEETEGVDWLDKLLAYYKTYVLIIGTAVGIGSILQKVLGDIESPEELHQRSIQNAKDRAEALTAEGDEFVKLLQEALDEYDKALAGLGIDKNHKKNTEKHLQDLDKLIHRNHLKIQKEYEQSITSLTEDEYAKRKQEATDAINAKNRELDELYRLNETYLNNVNGKYKDLTDEQRKLIQQQQEWILKATANNLNILAKQLYEIQVEQKANAEALRRESFTSADTTITGPQEYYVSKTVETDDGTKARLEALQESLNKEKQIRAEGLKASLKITLLQNQALIDAGEEGARSQEDIIREYQKEFIKLYAEYDKIILDMQATAIDNELELVKKGTEEELKLLLERNEAARKLAITENAIRPAAEQQSTEDINRLYDKKGLRIQGQFQLEGFEQAQAKAEAEFNIAKRNATAIKVFTLEQERDLWQKRIELAKAGMLDWSQAQIDEAEATIKRLNREISEEESFAKKISEKGIFGAILDKLGYDDDYINAMQKVVDTTIGNIQKIMDLEVEAAEQAVALAEKRVEAAKSAYDQEVEARNNGYANNVATAKKELQLARRQQLEKQKILEQAQRRQEAVNTAVQASSLVTATAELWASLSGIPIVGQALALAAIAAMWTSFAVAKVRAKQVTAASQEYGEGGLEFLEGGSHASGNDIDLHTKNSEGKNMRAEGGEAMAIINKKNTRKYKKVLPDIVNSLNKGNFESKYLKAFESGETLQAQIYTNSAIINLSKLEDSVEQIRRQGETQYIPMGDGSTMVITKNVRRIIR